MLALFVKGLVIEVAYLNWLSFSLEVVDIGWFGPYR